MAPITIAMPVNSSVYGFTAKRICCIRESRKEIAPQIVFFSPQSALTNRLKSPAPHSNLLNSFLETDSDWTRPSVNIHVALLLITPTPEGGICICEF